MRSTGNLSSHNNSVLPIIKHYISAITISLNYSSDRNPKLFGINLFSNISPSMVNFSTTEKSTFNIIIVRGVLQGSISHKMKGGISGTTLLDSTLFHVLGAVINHGHSGVK